MTPFLLLLSFSLSAGAGATESIVGEVVSAPADGARRFVVKKDGGGEIAVAFADTALFLRTRPGATTLTDAIPISASELVVGDRVLCRGTTRGDGTAFATTRVVVMTHSDLDARRAREREDWRKRGISGVITALDPAAREITVRVAAGARTVVVATDASRTTFRRYAASSTRFADARPGSFAELAVEDQVRVLGDRSADGARLDAEQVVSGAFRVIRGVLTDVDATKGTVSVQETARRGTQPRVGPGHVTVSLGPEALLRRLPPVLVMRLMRMAEGGPTGGAQEDPGTPARVGRTPDLDEMLERLPPIDIQDLRKGEEVAALGPRTSGTDVLMAMKLVVWTAETWPETRGARGRREGNEAPADPFTDLLGVGGESPW